MSSGEVGAKARRSCRYATRKEKRRESAASVIRSWISATLSFKRIQRQRRRRVLWFEAKEERKPLNRYML